MRDDVIGRRREASRGPETGWCRRAAAAPLAALWIAAAGVAPPAASPALSPPITQETSLAAAERHRHALRAGAGSWLRVEVEQRGVDVVLELVDPAGRTTRVDSPTGRHGPESLLARAATSGEWEVVVWAPPGGGSGTYRLRAEVLPADGGGEAQEALAAELATTAAAAAYHADDAAARREAIDRLAAALPAWPSPPPSSLARGLLLLAELERLEGRPAAARQRLVAALAQWRAAGDPSGEGRTLGALGYLAWSTGEVDEALELYGEAGELFRRNGDAHGEAQTLNNLGHALLSRGEPRRAEGRLAAAAAAARRAAAPRLEAAARNNLGGAAQVLGDLPEARAHFTDALRLYRTVGDQREAARALANLGSVERAAGAYSEAVGHYVAALAGFRAAGDAGGEATILNSLGATYLALGEPAAALARFERALPLRRAAGDRRGEASTLHNLGRALLALGEPAAARQRLSEALALRGELADRRGEATTLDVLAALELAAGRPQAAEPALRRALALFRRIEDRRREARALAHLAEAAGAAGRPADAAALFTAALALHGAQGDALEEAVTLEAQARFLRAAGRLEESARSVSRALELWESAGPLLLDPDLGASSFARRRTAYELAVAVAMERHRREPGRGHDVEALAIAERGRARGLLALLAEAGVELRRGVAPELLARRRALADRLAGRAGARRAAAEGRAAPAAATAGAEIADLLTELGAVEAEVRRRSPAYARLHEPPALDAAALRRLTMPDILLLEYALGEERSFLWAVDASGISSHELPGRAIIDEASRRLHASWSRHGAGGRAEADRRLAGELSETLLGPVASRLAGRRLAVVADGALTYLPFAALPLPSASAVGAGEPVVLHHEVVSLPSAAVLASLRASRQGRPRAPRPLVVVAPAPAGGAAGAGDLPWSRREGTAIAALAAGGTAVLAGADRAVLAGGLLGQFRTIHFATHGVLDSEHPRLSGLMLAGEGGSGDGFLYLQDIYDLELAADLVVLSGCRTALGREVRGEGLMGLARGFLAAGAARVVASLWAVEDRATAELMSRFYRELLAGGRAPAAALRAAQLDLRRQLRWRDPYHWSGFVLVGDWE